MRCICFILFFYLPAFASFNVPSGLDQNDRIETLKILGPGSAHRSLTAQFPLGGYSGFEVSLSRHYLNVADLSALGDGNSDEDNISYPVMTLGKGLFYDIDFFISFVPFAQSDTIQNVSTLVRWSFYQSEEWPIYLSAAINGGNSTYQNKLTTLNYGYDLYLNFKSQNLSLYFGLGTLFSTGQFVGGATGVTASNKSETENITSSHSVIGADLQLGNWFVVGQLDRYFDSFYSAKLGYRF